MTIRTQRPSFAQNETIPGAREVGTGRVPPPRGRGRRSIEIDNMFRARARDGLGTTRSPTGWWSRRLGGLKRRLRDLSCRSRFGENGLACIPTCRSSRARAKGSSTSRIGGTSGRGWRLHRWPAAPCSRSRLSAQWVNFSKRGPRPATRPRPRRPVPAELPALIRSRSTNRFRSRRPVRRSAARTRPG